MVIEKLDLSTVKGPSPELAAAVAIALGWRKKGCVWLEPNGDSRCLIWTSADGDDRHRFVWRPDLDDSPAIQLRETEVALTEPQWGRYTEALEKHVCHKHGTYDYWIILRFLRQAPAWLCCRELVRAVRSA